MDHIYNDPALSPLEFMLAVMHDTRLPMSVRMDAARAAAPYMPPAHTKTIHMKIEGGIPDFSDSCVDENDCCSRTTPCPWQRYYGHLCHEILQVKGHA
jgi:hypothetical protein